MEKEILYTLDIYCAAYLLAHGFELDGAEPWIGSNYRFTLAGDGVKAAAADYARDGSAPVQSLRNHLSTLKKIVHCDRPARGVRP